MALRALILEDDPSDAEQVIRELGRDRALVTQVVTTAAELRAALTGASWDLVVTDWQRTAPSALEVTELVRELGLGVPVLVAAGRRADDALWAAAERYRQLFESSPLPMWVYDTQTLGFLAVNDAAIQRYGYSRDEFLTRTLADLRPAEDVAALRADVAQRDDSPRVWRHITKHGEPLAVEITAHDLDYEGRRARLVLANDVTQSRRLEEQLRQSQKMEAVGRLAGGIAHDFNNILSVIMSYSETLFELLEPGDLRDDIEQIRNAGQRGAALTRQLLMFNRQQLIEPRSLDLNELIADMTRMLQRLLRADIELTVRAAPDLGAICVDPGSIEQVVMNLVVNAGDAMPAGGRLALTTANVELDARYADQHPGVAPGRYIRLEVADTGSGMDPATLARIFEPFFTTKERGRGTGLGLSVVFGIVQQSRGHITVASEPGRGTTFEVYLPRAEAAAAPERESPRPASLRGRETVLLVEDDRQVREVALSILRRHGYLVIAACDGDEAERSCEAHAHPIHLLLTDVVMPGISGRELARRLLHIRPGMKVLCMSGYSDEVDEPPISYLQKPFTAEALASAVRRALDGTGSSGNP